MTRQAIIDKTVKILKQLPVDKAVEVSDFADYLKKKYEDDLISKNIQLISSEGETFHFLSEEPEVYSARDLKEKYNE